MLTSTFKFSAHHHGRGIMLSGSQALRRRGLHFLVITYWYFYTRRFEFMHTSIVPFYVQREKIYKHVSTAEKE